jgi:outer membrane protein OmpA-like peptidoglycan-associated protein
MRNLKLALLAGVWLAWPGLALGQNVDRGTDVTVNPAAGGKSGMLLYPGGQYMRVVHPLLEPGAKDSGVVQLHMPSKRSVALRKTEAPTEEPAASKPVRQAKVEPAPAKQAKAAPEPKSHPAPKPVRQARAEPQGSAVATVPATSQPAYNPGFGNFPDQGAAGLNLGAAPTPPPAQAKRVAKANPPPASAAPASAGQAPTPRSQPQRVAKANPPPASAAPASSGEAPTPGLSKRSVILFAPQAADPAQSALGAIKFLAGDLNAAMTGPQARIQIQAYGGNRGDKGSDARRLSLKRALAIRQVLIDDGVPAERIDVRAMGGADDSGPADRVDVYVKV